MYRYRLEYLKDVSIHQHLIKEHQSIFDCLEQHDIEGAKKIINEHISKQYEDVIQNLKRNNPQ